MSEIQVLLRHVISRTKHGPDGRGSAGPCPVDCLKCWAEEKEAALRQNHNPILPDWPLDDRPPGRPDVVTCQCNPRCSGWLAHDAKLKMEGRAAPMPMLLWCPECAERHIDPSDFKPHHTHACQYCGHVWRPAVFETRGVQFLPGFKDAA